ncbi:flavodoxin family protein [Geoalkalibacter sp.]|uniref:flavodoxin family protein n=1 Tax=Geoalkalibacter sp. TaxID=3041440 RepID=UPI00272E082D|nr:flavodoxin family protein [Geoalkalibacter sp.]
MNLVCLLGSPRPRGNSTTLARHLCANAERRGADVRLFALNELDYRGCQACYACKRKLDFCILDDDLREVLAAVMAADALVLASPIYFGDVSAQLKGFIDRTFSYLVPDYYANPQPSRLPPDKKLVMILTQGVADAQVFADVHPRYEGFLKWEGFAESRLIRACGVTPATRPDKLQPWLDEAEDAARWLTGVDT